MQRGGNSVGEKKKLRLFLWPDCTRNCPGCCNNDWDIDGLPVITDFADYDEIMLTGGEPMLYPARLRRAIADIRKQHIGNIWIYTAHPSFSLLTFLLAPGMADGATVTLHHQSDVYMLAEFMWMMARFGRGVVESARSMRLNVFAGIDVTGLDTSGWLVKDGMEWIKDCPLPDGEVFGRWRDRAE